VSCFFPPRFAKKTPLFSTPTTNEPCKTPHSPPYLFTAFRRLCPMHFIYCLVLLEKNSNNFLVQNPVTSPRKKKFPMNFLKVPWCSHSQTPHLTPPRISFFSIRLLEFARLNTHLHRCPPADRTPHFRYFTTKSLPIPFPAPPQ